MRCWYHTSWPQITNMEYDDLIRCLDYVTIERKLLRDYDFTNVSKMLWQMFLGYTFSCSLTWYNYVCGIMTFQKDGKSIEAPQSSSCTTHVKQSVSTISKQYINISKSLCPYVYSKTVKTYKVNNRRRTGDLNFPVARTLVHTSRSRGTITPNTTVLRVSSVAAATVLSPHWAVEQIDWNKTKNITSLKQQSTQYTICATAYQQMVTLTIQILSTIYVKFIFPPYNDHGCILLH